MSRSRGRTRAEGAWAEGTWCDGGRYQNVAYWFGGWDGCEGDGLSGSGVSGTDDGSIGGWGISISGHFVRSVLHDAGSGG